MTTNQIKQIQEISKKMNIKYLYLFGSQARGKAGPLSDFDFAVKFDPKKTKDAFDAKLDLIGELCTVLKRDDVDVVDMDKANPYLLFNIIKDARKMYSSDEAERKMDKAKIYSVFLDRRYYYDRHFKRAVELMAK
jgi:uncharacterized protein